MVAKIFIKDNLDCNEKLITYSSGILLFNCHLMQMGCKIRLASDFLI